MNLRFKSFFLRGSVIREIDGSKFLLFNIFSLYNILYGSVVQWLERSTVNADVGGSNPSSPAKVEFVSYSRL